MDWAIATGYIAYEIRYQRPRKVNRRQFTYQVSPSAGRDSADAFHTCDLIRLVDTMKDKWMLSYLGFYMSILPISSQP